VSQVQQTVVTRPVPHFLNDAGVRGRPVLEDLKGRLARQERVRAQTQLGRLDLHLEGNLGDAEWGGEPAARVDVGQGLILGNEVHKSKLVFFDGSVRALAGEGREPLAGVLPSLLPSNGPVSEVAFSPDGRTVLASDRGLWEAEAAARTGSVNGRFLGGFGANEVRLLDASESMDHWRVLALDPATRPV